MLNIQPRILKLQNMSDQDRRRRYTSVKWNQKLLRDLRKGTIEYLKQENQGNYNIQLLANRDKKNHLILKKVFSNLRRSFP